VGVNNYVNLLGAHADAVTGSASGTTRSSGRAAQHRFHDLGVPLGIVGGLSLAMLLDTKVRGLHVYRTIFYLPAIVPAVASFILWLWIFAPGNGLLNEMLIALGVPNPPNWLQDPVWQSRPCC